ncbi:MAG: DUF4129 domain-containing protein [Thermoguttaceae bacterium]
MASAVTGEQVVHPLAASPHTSCLLTMREAAPAGSPPTNFHRRTRSAIKEVLAQPEFGDLRADPSALSRQFIEWLSSMTHGIASAIGMLPTWLWWLIVVWMIVTLVAILAHLLYTLVIMLGGVSRSSHRAARRGHPGQLLGVPELEFDSIYEEARRLLADGDWLAATKYLYVAAILWLDRQGAIVFRLSKTNHDYIRELRTRVAIQAAFRRLTGCFEPIMYGGQPASMSNSEDMAKMVEGLLHEPAVAIAP